MQLSKAALLLSSVPLASCTADTLPNTEPITAEVSQSQPRPNLLVIHTDEHNFRTLGCYRDTLPAEQGYVWGKGVEVKTPHIDSLAEGGAIATNFYASSPVCTPSRAAFFSGQYPQSVGAYKNNAPLSDSAVTFAAVLQKHNYKTGYAGKWHLDGFGKPQWAPVRKFGFEDNRFMFNRGHWKKITDTPNGPSVNKYKLDGADEKTFTTDYLADRCVDFIKENKDNPFCYVVSLPDPHGPNTVRTPYDTMYENLKFQMPPTYSKSRANAPSWAKPKRGRPSMSKYFGMVKCIDDNVGKMIKALKDNGVFENTIIVFTADHGDMCYEHGRHNKGIPLEASAKIPLIIHYPPQIKKGTKIDNVLSCVDFKPTILGLINNNMPTGPTEGHNASGIFKGKDDASWENVAFLREGVDKGWVAVVTKKYKLVLSPVDKPWLLDRTRDVDELNNFCFDPSYRKTVRELAIKLNEYAKQHKDMLFDNPKTANDLNWAMGQELNYPN